MIDLKTKIVELNTLNKGDEFNIDSLKKILLENRGLNTIESQNEFLNPKNPLSLTLSDFEIDETLIATAILRIEKAIDERQKIVIYGDYDADGVCATAVLWLSLKYLGVTSIPFIPKRDVHGYGLSIKGLEEIIKKHSPDLIITVDNGIVAHESAEFLNQKKIDLIITDHHQTDGTFPKALEIIHSTKVCGTAVSWVLSSCVLKSKLEKTEADKVSESLLDLVAIGSVADLMPMIGVNRSLVKFGLKELTKSKKPGLIELKAIAGISDNQPLNSYHVGYMLGPRINAMGRIGDGLDALRLLCTANLETAKKLAQTLQMTNIERQDLTQISMDLAVDLYLKVQTTEQRIIVIAHEDFHEGVIGLIAGKLVERFYKPAIVISKSEGVSKGSARSITGVNIVDLIRSCNHLLLGAGGHPGAAGLSINTEKIEEFNLFIQGKATEVITLESLEKSVAVECKLPIEAVNLETYSMIQEFEPFGIGNPKPKFLFEGRLLGCSLIGRDGNHLKCYHEDIEVLNFNTKVEELPDPSIPTRYVATIGENTWKGNTKVQLIVS